MGTSRIVPGFSGILVEAILERVGRSRVALGWVRVELRVGTQSDQNISSIARAVSCVISSRTWA